jgi:hypothetical protein
VTRASAASGIGSRVGGVAGRAADPGVRGFVVRRSLLRGHAQRGRRSHAGRDAARFERPVLCPHLVEGAREVVGADLPGIGKVDDVAGLDAIDVAVDEGLGIETLDIEHRLLYRDTRGLAGAGYLPQGLVAPDHVAAARCRRRRGLRGKRPLRHLAGGKVALAQRHAVGAARRLGLRLRLRRVELLEFTHALTGGHRDALGAKRRRIHEHRVLAQQAARGPARLDDQVQVGLEHRLFGHQAYHALVRIDLELDAGQEIGSLDAEAIEIVDTGKAHANVIDGQFAQVKEFHLCIEGFIQERLQLQFAETQGGGLRAAQECENPRTGGATVTPGRGSTEGTTPCRGALRNAAARRHAYRRPQAGPCAGLL